MAKDKDVEEGAEEGRSKKTLIIIIVAALLILGGGGAGAYFFLLSGDDEGVGSDDVLSAERAEVATLIAEPEIGETLYHELENSFTVNILDSGKMMQVKLALRTPYGKEMMDKIVAHEFGMRAALLEELSKISEERITAIDFRKSAAEELRLVANSVLGEQKIYSGIDLVLFTEFLVQ